MVLCMITNLDVYYHCQRFFVETVYYPGNSYHVRFKKQKKKDKLGKYMLWVEKWQHGLLRSVRERKRRGNKRRSRENLHELFCGGSTEEFAVRASFMHRNSLKSFVKNFELLQARRHFFFQPQKEQ